MIVLSDHIHLQALTLSDHSEVYQLLQTIYTPAYGHYWEDNGKWYLDQQYQLEHFTKELNEKKSKYYLINYSDKNGTSSVPIGIFKYNTHTPYAPLPEYRAFKIHRLYLAVDFQGKGIGKLMMQYAQKIAKKDKHQLIWLDAMDTHVQAQSFYKSLGFVKTTSRVLPFELMRDEHRQIWYLHKML
ncbi:MAG: GNAT family N-acetyltransferase [Dokdonia sp.]|jgi:ribosomal protein S18 acetylase RimI-like enzyme